MSSLYTPGPWAWDEDGHTLAPVDKSPDISAVHTILSPDGCFGYLGSELQATLAEDEANKRLIAAAPDLLEALQDALEAVNTFHGPDAWDIYWTHSPEMKRARVAIAKATGSAS